MKTSKGFSIIEAVLILVVVVAIAAVGYLAYTNFLADDNTSQDEGSATVVMPEKIESIDDIDEVNTKLSEIELQDSDNEEFDKAVESFSQE